MRPMTIHFSSGRSDDPPREFPGLPLAVDLSPLERHYQALGKRHVPKVEAFRRFWAQEGEGLLAPRASVAGIAPEEVADVLPREVTGSAGTLVLMVWTLGDGLERECERVMSQQGNAMWGLLLDVAGSIALYDMHRLLREWVGSPDRPFGENHVVGEFYPGSGNTSRPLVESVERLGRTAATLGAETRGSVMFHPRKTQYSFLCLGKEGGAFFGGPSPCSPCAGRRCLYYQLGGCHLGLRMDSREVES